MIISTSINKGLLSSFFIIFTKNNGIYNFSEENEIIELKRTKFYKFLAISILKILVLNTCISLIFAGFIYLAIESNLPNETINTLVAALFTPVYATIVLGIPWFICYIPKKIILTEDFIIEKNLFGISVEKISLEMISEINDEYVEKIGLIGKVFHFEKEKKTLGLIAETEIEEKIISNFIEDNFEFNIIPS